MYFNLNSIKINSKKVQNFDLFVPIIGNNFDGHDFIKSAFQNGALAVLCDESKIFSIKEQISKKNIIIIVENTQNALQEIAGFYRKKFNIPIVGITGSVGKSTVKQMLASVMSFHFSGTPNSDCVLCTKGNLNGQLGVPLTLLDINSKTKFAIIEMGVSLPGEMHKLNKIVDPNFAIITNIGVSHLANFNKIENTCSEKLEIINKDKFNKIFINSDNQILLNMTKKCIKNEEKIVYFGLNNNSLFKIENLNFCNNKTEFDLISPEFCAKFTIPCAGEHNIINSLAVVAFSLKYNVKIINIIKGIQNFKNLPMRQEISEIHNIFIINDSYNASPDSMKSSLKTLENMKISGEKIAVIADMQELGEKSNEIHEEIGEFLSKMNINIVITIGVLSGFIAKILQQKKIIKLHACDNTNDAFEILKKITKKFIKNVKCDQHAILFKGSRAAKLEILVENLEKYLKKYD
ncbi:MAG: UDP-N-acetylmuramoyl-tripeptide--D-alanyl-D-alanine ligase [Candidatus Improbicoccus devescovinae]|nr:MAG: UDP-N-acetylmuramoyl-tripeptide--D-alanyl-D-alanine ligase [Candidatus Improbicoccus devescovinae]